MDPDHIQDLVTIAFCLEPLADKEGCTTRYKDIPGKPLTDFIIAGINVGKYFRKFAQDVQRDSQTPIFGYYVDALENANRYKSEKIINFGLLEVMFPAVYARLLNPSKESVVDMMVSVMKREHQADAMHMIDARLIAWKTSSSPEKRNYTGVEFRDVASPFSYYERVSAGTESGSSSGKPWADQWIRGLPIIRATMAHLRQGGDVLEALGSGFTDVKSAEPTIQVGTIADMCAAALFLHLSYERHS